MPETFKPWGGTRPAIEDPIYEVFIDASLLTAQKFAAKIQQLDDLIALDPPDKKILEQQRETLRLDTRHLCQQVIYLEAHKYDDPRLAESPADEHF